MKFYVNVVFHPPPLDQQNGGRLRRNVRSDDGSKEKLLGDMDSRSLVRDWDAIMAVNAERVNELWKQQYESQSNAGFRKRIVTDRSLTLDTRFSKMETRCILEVGSPKIQFVRNNQNKVFISNII